MPNTHEELLDLLTKVLFSFQSQFIEGISEFEIISILKKRPYNLLNADALSDSLLLFQTHFILFHALYLLRHEWREAKVGELDIGATLIKLTPPLFDNANIQVGDPLADYYLDWQNLAQTDQAGVDGLLANFWLEMGGYDAYFDLSQDELKNAKTTLELPANSEINLSQLKRQYRKLQHKHHPDKGGSSNKSQLILQAYTTLHRYLSNELTH